MSLSLQRDNLGSLRYAADVCWRDSASNLTDNVIAGALRDLECNVDLYQRLLGDAALQDLERETYHGIQLQVRTMRIERFPCMSLPIRLDWRRAWTPTQWAEFTDAVEAMEAGDEKSALEAKIAAIRDCFDEESPPFSVTYPDCDGERIAMDPDGLVLLNAGSGDQIVLKSACHSCCTWPHSNWWGVTFSSNWARWGFHDVPNNRFVEVKYLVGYARPADLMDREPSIVANIAALFNYRFENPEIMGGQSSKTYELLTRHFQKQLKWRV